MKKILLIVISMFISISFVEAKSINVKLDKCIDGDTASFIYKGEKIKARFLAIDTPELHDEDNNPEPYAEKAKEYTCNKLTKANKITLEYDDKSDEKDIYDRHLVWVYVDDKLLQKELINKGYAKVAYIYKDYKYVDELRLEEEKAKSKEIGLWSNEDNGLLNKLLYDNGEINYFTLSIFIIIIIIAYFINKIVRKEVNKKIKKKIRAK